MLSLGQAVTSPETRLQYRVERFLGSGGFGQAFLARRLGRSAMVPEMVCIKASRRIDGWLREAYFGQLLDGHARAIRVFDAFPLPPTTAASLYCLALEYAPHGDLSAFLQRDRARWPKRRRGARSRASWRCWASCIAGSCCIAISRRSTSSSATAAASSSATSASSGSRATTAASRRARMNALTAPSDILARAAPKWQARDDVYQVGQLLGMLVKGDAGARIRTADVRALVQRSPEGNRLPLHRRAAQALRERR